MTIGETLTTKNFSTADIVYSIKITAAAASNVATLDLATGVVTKTTGSPSVARRTGGTSDLAALDFEGATISNVVTGHAILVTPTVIVGNITVASSSSGCPDYTFTVADPIVPLFGPFTPNGNVAFTFANASDSVTVTVIGKSS